MTEDEVIARGDGWDIYWFAIQHPNANIARLQEAVIKSKHPFGILYFTHVSGSDIELLGEAIRKTNNPNAISMILLQSISASLRDKLEKQLLLAALVDK